MKKFKFNLRKHWWMILLAVIVLILILKGKGFMGAAVPIYESDAELCESTGGTVSGEILIVCGTIAGIQCPQGYTCQLDNPNAPDSSGHCVTAMLSIPGLSCDCPSGTVWDGALGCKVDTQIQCSTAADCPQDTCTGYRCINGYCQGLVGMPAPPNCPNEPYYGASSQWLGYPDCKYICKESPCASGYRWDTTYNHCVPEICPAVCVPIATLSNGKCTFDGCGSGCLMNTYDHITTFPSLEQCECKLNGGEWYHIMTVDFVGPAPAPYCKMPDNDQVCCDIISYGSEMVRGDRYEKMPRDQCSVPSDWVGGDRIVVPDSLCEEKPIASYWIYILVGGLVIVLIYILYPRKRR